MNKPIDKMIFDRTVHRTLRVWMYFNEENISNIFDTKEFRLFQLLGVWGGYDKNDHGMYSWELPLSLEEYIRDKFADKNNVEILL